MNLIDMFFRSSAEINGYFNREEIEFPCVTVLHEMWAITEHYQTTRGATSNKYTLRIKFTEKHYNTVPRISIHPPPYMFSLFIALINEIINII